MKFQHIALVAWKTFRHNSDKTALYLEISTVFCLSLCIGIILGLNAIFSDLMNKSMAIAELHSPLLVKELKDDKSIYDIHEGLNIHEDITKFSVAGLELKAVARNIVINQNKDYFIVMPTRKEAVCMTPKELNSFTVYDISEGLNALGLPMNMASFNCKWQLSSVPIIEVPQKIWSRVYGDKKFVYAVKFTDFDKPYERIQELNSIAEKNNYIVINKTLMGIDYIKISILQKKIFDIVFSLLCILLMALMLMNCMIFIKNRANDWKLFYLFRVSSLQTNCIIITRFIFIFFVTVFLSFFLGLIVANSSTEIVKHYLLGNLGNIDFSYHFEIKDILFTYSLVFLIFAISGLITIKGIQQGTTLKSQNLDKFSIEHLNVSYHTLTQGNVPVLKDVSITLKPYELTAIVGVSGSGKTTLLNSIFNNKYLDKNVFLNISETTYVTQYPNLIQELTIEQNLMLFSHLPHEKMIKLSEDFGITKILSNYPQETSVGERQRACIIRALLTGKSYLILDEPTASLDASNKVLVIDIIKKLMNNKILKYVLIVTHDPVVVDKCDSIYELDSNVLTLKI